MKPRLRLKALVHEALDAFWSTIKAAPVYAEHVEVMEAAELERVAMRAAGAWMHKAGIEDDQSELRPTVPYEDPRLEDAATVYSQDITMADLQMVALVSIANEVARRGELARRRNATGDRDRFLRLRRAANELRIVCGAPPFAWPEGS